LAAEIGGPSLVRPAQHGIDHRRRHYGPLPNIRVGTLEAGHGWLPAWVNRLEEHTKLCPEALPPSRKPFAATSPAGATFKASKSPKAKRYPERIDLLGPDILMFGSDYPHGESWFPVAVENVLGWKLKEDDKRRIFWDNA
jgi:predicted TIM-barrel fold metal-dependent hydrolase